MRWIMPASSWNRAGWQGRLSYADYEAWRAGERDFLDEQLFGDPQQSRALLEQGAAYATDLGLEADLFNYTRWSGGEGNKLCFSPDYLFDRLFHTRYRKPVAVPQLDLFMDAAGVTLVNGVIGALVARDPTEARRLLEHLLLRPALCPSGRSTATGRAGSLLLVPPVLAFPGSGRCHWQRGRTGLAQPLAGLHGP